MPPKEKFFSYRKGGENEEIKIVFRFQCPNGDLAKNICSKGEYNLFKIKKKNYVWNDKRLSKIDKRTKMIKETGREIEEKDLGLILKNTFKAKGCNGGHIFEMNFKLTESMRVKFTTTHLLDVHGVDEREKPMVGVRMFDVHFYSSRVTGNTRRRLMGSMEVSEGRKGNIC